MSYLDELKAEIVDLKHKVRYFIQVSDEHDNAILEGKEPSSQPVCDALEELRKAVL